MAADHSNKTLVVSGREVRTLLCLRDLIEGIGHAYLDYGTDRPTQPQRAVANMGCSSIVINFPGVLPRNSSWTVKANVKTPSNPEMGLPFVMGAILMLDCGTGRPVALLESSLITAMRTCAAGAVGVRTLARPEANKVAIIGAGNQGAWQLRALLAIDRLHAAWVYDRLPQRAADFAASLTAELRVNVEATASVREAVEQADIIVTATQSVVPLITSELVVQGIHINAFGADEPGKVEIDADVLRASLVVVDDRQLALSDGTMNVACKNGQLGAENIHAEIGEVLAGKLPGRQTDEQITIFGSVGLAHQDLVACTLIYEKAVSAGLGTWIDLR